MLEMQFGNFVARVEHVFLCTSASPLLERRIVKNEPGRWGRSEGAAQGVAPSRVASQDRHHTPAALNTPNIPRSAAPLDGAPR